MDKKFDAYKTIGEVSKELNIPTHIIRFWETKFERLKSVKRKNNHRYYSKEDIIFILYLVLYHFLLPQITEETLV